MRESLGSCRTARDSGAELLLALHHRKFEVLAFDDPQQGRHVSQLTLQGLLDGIVDSRPPLRRAVFPNTIRPGLRLGEAYLVLFIHFEPGWPESEYARFQCYLGHTEVHYGLFKLPAGHQEMDVSVLTLRYIHGVYLDRLVYLEGDLIEANPSLSGSGVFAC